MGKKEKKEKEKKDENVLYRFDNALDAKYLQLRDEIVLMQAEVDREVRKAKKKALKRMKKGNSFYEYNTDDVRRTVIRHMEKTDFFTRVEEALQAVRPIVYLIAELVKSLIIAILNIDAVKYRINPRTLHSMQSVYSLASSVTANRS